MKRLRVCVVTGTRAEYGLLKPVLTRLLAHPRFELVVVATGAHLSPEFGLTVQVIEADGFSVERVEMLLSSDTPAGITKSLGLATIGFADAFARLEPDLVLVLGDRYEILAVAQAALLARIPLAHIFGGDVTEGALDDSIRHAVTKMAHLHFPTNADSAARIRQMGEPPERVIMSGNPGIDDLIASTPLDRDELGRSLGFELRQQNLIVTYHPATAADEEPVGSFAELLAALEMLGSDVGIVITLTNADAGGRALIPMSREFAANHANVVTHPSLGQERYWSCLKTFDAIVGNSSSALIEAPAVGLPAINIGKRQLGRLRSPDSTLDVGPERNAIHHALRTVLSWSEVAVTSPYGDGHASERIIRALERIESPESLLEKRFQEIPTEPRGHDQ